MATGGEVAVIFAAALALALVLPACRSDGPRASARSERTRSVRLPSVTLHTVEVGARERPVRLALHGGPGLDHTYLRPWLDPLGDDARLVYVDLRGHGRSSAPPSAEGYTIPAAADDLAALTRSLGVDAVDVLAHDFGATVALSLAQRHPEVVRSLVLVAPLRDAAQVRAVATRTESTLGATVWREIQDLSTPQGTLRDARSLPVLFRRLGPMWWHTPPSDAVIAGMSRSMVYRAEADANFLQAAARWDASLVAPEVRAPALVISGRDDRTFLADESRGLADALPHGRYVAIDAAGHLPFIERQGEFLRAVRDFWAGRAPVAPAAPTPRTRTRREGRLLTPVKGSG